MRAMTAELIDGKIVSEKIRAAAAAAVAKLPGSPALLWSLWAMIQRARCTSNRRVRRPRLRACARSRSASRRAAAQAEIETELKALSADPEVDGILLQLPLPKGLDEAQALALIDPIKDVDGLTELSAGRLVLGKPGLRPCTPVGCVIMAKHALGPDLSGRHVVVIGRSILVGKPVSPCSSRRTAR